jgi:hypothetical protein
MTTATGGKRAWLIGGSILAVVAVSWLAWTALSLLARDEERQPVSFDDETITRITLDGDAGSVSLVGGEVDVVTGERVVVRSLLEPSWHEEVVDGELRLDTSCPPLAPVWCEVRYELSVPRGTTLDIDSSGGGIRVEEINGAMTLSSSGGGITIVGGTGDVSASSSGGGIRLDQSGSRNVTASSSGGSVRLDFAVTPVDVDADSSGGGGTVAVPDGPNAYAVDAESSGGGTNVEVATDPDALAQIRVRSSGGGVTVTYRD